MGLSVQAEHGQVAFQCLVTERRESFELPDRREALRRAMRQNVLGDGPDGPFTLQAKAWAVRGMVP